MPSFIDIPPGKNPAAATDIQQIIDALKGTIGKGIPLSPSAVNDAIAYAFSAKNLDATNSRAGIFYKADGSVLLQIDKNGVQASPDGSAAAAPVLTAAATQTLTNKTLDGNTNTIKVQRGTLASRPAAGTAGLLYLATDQAPVQLWEDTGTTWILIAGPSSLVANLATDTNLAANTTTTLCTLALGVGTWLIAAGLQVNCPTAGTLVGADLRDATNAVPLRGGTTQVSTTGGDANLQLVRENYTLTAAASVVLEAQSVTNASTARAKDRVFTTAQASYALAIKVGG